MRDYVGLNEFAAAEATAVAVAVSRKYAADRAWRLAHRSERMAVSAWRSFMVIMHGGRAWWSVVTWWSANSRQRMAVSRLTQQYTPQEVCLPPAQLSW